MGFSLDARGKPIYNGTPQTIADLQGAADWADKVGGVLRVTQAERLALTSSQVSLGWLVVETDTGMLYQRTAGGWALMSRAVLSVVRENAFPVTQSVSTDVPFGGGSVVQIGHGIDFVAATGIATISIPGLYRCRGQGTWAGGGAANSHYLMLSKNNAEMGAGSAMASLAVTDLILTQSVETEFQLGVGDTVRLKAYQASASTKDLGVPGAAYYTSLTIERMVQ